jgi:hypothetical protein
MTRDIFRPLVNGTLIIFPALAGNIDKTSSFSLVKCVVVFFVAGQITFTFKKHIKS